MSKHPIGTVVNFCTNESRFIGTCLKEALRFSSQVVVPVASHFFDGMPENRGLLKRIYAAFPECLFIEYPFIPDQIPKSVFQAIRPSAFWHCLSRLIGASFLRESLESVLFLDADEIADGRRVAEWIGSGGHLGSTAQKLSNYWYFREPVFQAEHVEDSIVLVERKILSSDLLLQNEERNALYDLLPGPKKRGVMGLDGKPLFHHFSWVRTEDEMLKKVRSWGHRKDKDRDWEALVKEEFSRPFNGIDFVHGYRFRAIEPQFTFSSDFTEKGRGNVLYLSERQVKEFAKMKKQPFWKKFFSFLRR